VLDYQTQQYKLFPLLASAYAFWFSGLKMRHTYFSLNYEILQGKTGLLPEVTASVSWTNFERLLTVVFVNLVVEVAECYKPSWN